MEIILKVPIGQGETEVRLFSSLAHAQGYVDCLAEHELITEEEHDHLEANIESAAAPNDEDRCRVIIGLVAQHYRISQQAILARSRRRDHDLARCLAMAIAREFTAFSDEDLARVFKRCRHMVQHHIAAARAFAAGSPRVARAIEEIREAARKECA